MAQSVLQKGKFFCEGIEDIANDNGFEFNMTGPPSMPYPWFNGDDNLFLIQKFCEYASQEGLFFHPYHNWFISNAHTQDTLLDAMERSREAFVNLRKELD